MQVAERREIRLKEWEEAIGTFKGIKREEFSISIRIDNFCMIFSDASTEAQIVEEKLYSVTVGDRIAILRTDLPEKTIVVRITEAGDEYEDETTGGKI